MILLVIFSIKRRIVFGKFGGMNEVKEKIFGTFMGVPSEERELQLILQLTDF